MGLAASNALVSTKELIELQKLFMALIGIMGMVWINTAGCITLLNALELPLIRSSVRSLTIAFGFAVGIV